VVQAQIKYPKNLIPEFIYFGLSGANFIPVSIAMQKPGGHDCQVEIKFV